MMAQLVLLIGSIQHVIHVAGAYGMFHALFSPIAMFHATTCLMLTRDVARVCISLWNTRTTGLVSFPMEKVSAQRESKEENGKAL